jgi:hypothetical protein
VSTDSNPVRPALQALRTRVRGLYLLHGTGRVATVLGGLLLLSFLLDWWLAPPRGVRLVHGILSLVALGWAIRRFLVMPLRLSLTDLTDEELAAAVEARVPRLQDRLLGALQWDRLLADPECGESEAMMRASAAEAAEAIRTVQPSDLTDSRIARTSLFAGCAVAGILVLAAAAWHEEALLWARRSLLLLDEPWPRRTTLVVLGFDPPENPRVVTVGDDLPVEVRVEGAVPDDGVTIQYQTLPAEGGRVERDARPMLQSAEDPRSFAFVFHEVPASFRFWVSGGDDTDGEPRYTVRALVPPAIEEVVADLVFPPQTGLAPERRVEGDLEVPAGTKADLAVRASVALKAASFVHPAGAAPAPLEVGPDGRTVRVSVVVKETSDWRLDMEGTDGARSNPSRNTRRFTALPDPRPDVRMLLPTTRVFSVADGRVPVKVTATDNYSLERVALEIVPGRGKPAVEIPLAAFAAPPGAAERPKPVRAATGYRLLDLASLAPPEGEKGFPLEDEVLVRGTATDNGGSTSATEQVAIQITDPAEMLRRLTQKQTRIREDLEALRHHLESARDGALRARDALAAADLTPGDRESLRVPGSASARSQREASDLADSLGDVLLTYALNRLVENRVGADRLVAVTDDWLREDGGQGAALKPALWRRLAAAHDSREIDDSGILGSLLDALGLSDRLATGPSATLRERLEALSSGTAQDPKAAAGAAVRAADEALALVREIDLHLQEWETLHEILEATRSLLEQQESILRGLRGSGGSPPERK